MKAGMLLTAGAALLVTGACSRGADEGSTNNPAGVDYNQQTGVLTTKQGLQANGLSAAGDCLSPSGSRRKHAATPAPARMCETPSPSAAPRSIAGWTGTTP